MADSFKPDSFKADDGDSFKPDATPAAPRTWLDSAADVVKGFWGNLADTGQGMINTVAHPIETAKGIVDTQDAQRLKAEESFKRGDYVGGIRHVLGYAVPLLGPPIFGDLPDKASSGKPGDLPQAMGGALSLGLQLAGPGALARSVGTAPAAAAAAESADHSPIAARLYHEALKPNANTPAAEVRSMVQTGLEHKIPVSEAGAAKLNALLADLNQKIEGKVAPAAERGVKVNPYSVVDRLGDVEDRVRYQVNPEEDIRSVNKTGQEFLRSQGATPEQPAVAPKPTGILDAQGRPMMDAGKPVRPGGRAQPIPADEAQAIKIGTYRKLAGKYGEMAPDAKIEAQKALARGIKEELSAQIPELADLNAKEGSLFDLKGPLESAVNKAANRQGRSMGLPAAVTGVAVGEMAGAPAGAAAAVLKQILANPEVRSRLAIAINQARRANPAKWGAPSMEAANARVASFVSALDEGLANKRAAEANQ